MSGITRTTRDHEIIRKWVEARGGHPARVAGTERDGAGIIRIQFPDSDGANQLEPIGWTDFFSKFDENELAFVYQETTSDGELSRFNRLVND